MSLKKGRENYAEKDEKNLFRISITDFIICGNIGTMYSDIQVVANETAIGIKTLLRKSSLR